MNFSFERQGLTSVRQGSKAAIAIEDRKGKQKITEGKRILTSIDRSVDLRTSCS